MKQTFLLFLCISFSSLFAQTPFDWWFFGWNSGIHFTSGGGAPVAVSGGQVVTSEGCTTISDAGGNLLFYTDGITVWNRNHVQMPNGTGLLGDPSSATSAIAIPYVGSSSKYMIITNEAYGSVNLSCRYSELDMSLAGGLGDVIPATKNTLITNNSVEALAVVQKPNGYWLVATICNSNMVEFHSFEITASGINLTPVVSQTNSDCTLDASGNATFINKINAASGKLVLTSYNWTKIHDFDGVTGQVSSPFSLVSNVFCYGTEFSPNNQFLYVADASSTYNIYQYDITLPNNAAVLASQTVVGTGPTTLGALQLGPDNKIYISELGNSSLGVINNPDLAGLASNYQSAAIALTGSTDWGLPNFVSGISFTQPTHVDGSLDVLTPDGILCGNQITPIFQLTNTGDTTIFNFSISYTINGGTPMIYNWFGSLDTTQSVTITLPILNVGVGMQNLQMTLNTVNNAADGNGSNNSDNANINVIAITGQPLPLQEGFEGLAFPPNHMQVINAAGTTWQKTTNAARAGIASVYMDNFTLNNQLGAVDDIHIDGFSFPFNQTITFEFDVAYAPYTVGESDTLQVLISTDCGQTFQTLYDLSGASLYTAPPTNGAFVPTSWSQWKHFNTDLSGHGGNPNVEFIFRCRNSYENNLYLDNINIIASAVSIDNPNDLGVVHIFPNPATEILNIEYQGIKQGATEAILFDLSGKVVKSQTLPLNEGFNLAQMQLSDLAKGVYMLQVGEGEKAFREKVVLR